MCNRSFILLSLFFHLSVVLMHDVHSFLPDQLFVLLN